MSPESSVVGVREVTVGFGLFPELAVGVAKGCAL